MTPPKPTIREIEKILIKYLPIASIPTEDWNSVVKELSALLPPQTGEGKKLFPDLIQKPIKVEEVPFNLVEELNKPATAEEMEWEKEWDKQNPFNRILLAVSDIAWGNSSLTAGDGRQIAEDVAKAVTGTKKDVKAFLRKQLDLQEKRFREMIGQDEAPSLAIINLSKSELNTVKNEFRAELRSKLSVQKGEK